MKSKCTNVELAELLGVSLEDLKDRGWSVDAPLVPRHKFQEWTYDELIDLPDSQWLAGDEERPVLIANGLWLNYGLFKGGKTYRSMELAFCIAFGLEFHGLPVTQGNVAYVIAEGGTKRHLKRLLALCEKYKLDPAEALNSGKFNLITTAVNLAEARMRASGSRACTRGTRRTATSSLLSCRSSAPIVCSSVRPATKSRSKSFQLMCGVATRSCRAWVTVPRLINGVMR